MAGRAHLGHRDRSGTPSRRTLSALRESSWWSSVGAGWGDALTLACVRARTTGVRDLRCMVSLVGEAPSPTRTTATEHSSLSHAWLIATLLPSVPLAPSAKSMPSMTVLFPAPLGPTMVLRLGEKGPTITDPRYDL